MLIAELNAFYLKYILWIPPEHILNVLRLLLHAFMGTVAVRETFQYFTDEKCKKIGAQCWITIMIIIMEVIICFKFGKNLFPNPAPKRIVGFWIIFALGIVIFPIWQFYYKSKSSNKLLKIL